MRILRVIRSVNPAGGGPIEGIKQISAAQMADGHQVEIASLDRPSDRWVGKCGLKVHALGNGGGKYGFSARFVPWLRENHLWFDGVVISGLWQYQSYGAWRALRNCRTPYFVFPHGMLDPWFKHAYPLKHVKKWIYWQTAERRVLRDARAVLFTCEEERRAARQSFLSYHCREKVLSYGTAGPEGDAEQQKEVFLSRFPELRGKWIILFLGRIHEKKGCDLLIKAFHRVRSTKREPERLHLVMAGPDQNGWQTRLQTLAGALSISDAITWPGMLSGDLKWGAFHAAEVFALPSHQENFGIAVAEALACGLPVLISNKINIWREIEGDSAGWVDEDDEDGTARLLERWLQLPESGRDELRRNALRCFERRFEVRQAAESLIASIDRGRIE